MKAKVNTFSWPEIGDAYQAFSALSDEGDWQFIMSQIASFIAVSNFSSLKILDYGAGVGSTAASIRRRLYGNHGLVSSWDIFEPDPYARHYHNVMMPDFGEKMSVKSLGCLSSDSKYDVALFIHTSYYIEDFCSEVERIFRDYIEFDTGIVVCLAMPSSSPFFIPNIFNRHSWVAEDIVQAISAIGFNCSTVQLRSRFRWTDRIDNTILPKLVTSFVFGHTDISDNEINIVRNSLSGEVDFNDRLIVIRR